MSFDELYKNKAPEDYTGSMVMGSEGTCWICERKTCWIDIVLEVHICCEACSDEAYKRIMELIRGVDDEQKRIR